MAITGNLSTVKSKFFKDQLNVVFEYLTEAEMDGSAIRERIFSRDVGAFEKIDLGDGIFALEQVFLTKSNTECFYESHVRYIDFQLNLFGVEQMEWIDKGKMKRQKSFDQQRDLIIYEEADNTSKLVMLRGDLAIYFPEDVHMGLGWYNNEISKVYKTVVKVPVEYYESL